MEQDLTTIPTSTAPSEATPQGGSANGTTASVRYISAQAHQEIKRKVLTLHEGLLRRLAEHDHQR
jgi:hypothetical protein